MVRSSLPYGAREAVIFEHILVATDGSALADRAVAQGIALAKAVGARVSIITVPEPFASLGRRREALAHLPADLRRQAETYLDAECERIASAAMARAAEAGVAADARTWEAAAPHLGILAAAGETGADLIVMASHGRSGFGALLLGSVTQKVLAHATLPVLVCR